MWYNRLVITLLRSPVHGVLDKASFMLLTYTGRKSGKSYTIPLQYVRSSGKLLIVTSTDRTWWRNLRGDAPVSVHISGRDVQGIAHVYEQAESIPGLMSFLKSAPYIANYFHVNLTADGLPDAADVAQAARGKVVVEVQPIA